MKYARYRRTVLVSHYIRENLGDLVTFQYISNDVEAAAHLAPLRFNSVQDRMFYDGYLVRSTDARLPVALSVQEHFDRWYSGASPAEKAYLACSALTLNWEIIDTTVDTIIGTLSMDNRIPLVDSDDTIASVTDYHAVRDPAKIAKILDQPDMVRWCAAMRGMVDRVAEAPPVPVEHIYKMGAAVRTRNHTIREYYRADVHLKTGIRTKTARKHLRRSYRLLTAVYGAEAARNFIDGIELRIPATLFVWGIKLTRGRLIEQTIDPSSYHTPFRITLYDHDGETLCRACVLFPNTPVLDQAVGFRVATANVDDEREFLAKANLFEWTAAGLKHPGLAEQAAEYRDDIDNVICPPETREVERSIMTGSLSTPETREVSEYVTNVIMMTEGQVEPTPEEPFAPELPQTEEWGSSVDVDSALDFGTPYNPMLSDTYDIMTASEPWREPDEEGWYWRRWRKHNDLIQLVQGMLLDRIGGRADILDYMTNPDSRIYGWFTHDGSLFRRMVTARVRSFIETKSFEAAHAD